MGGWTDGWKEGKKEGRRGETFFGRKVKLWTSAQKLHFVIPGLHDLYNPLQL